MRFEIGFPGDLLRRLAVGALFAVTAAVLAAPAYAQTIRFSPAQPNFPIVRDPNGRIDPNLSVGSVDIFVDNVPAAGLKGFDIRFSFDESLLTLISSLTSFDPNALDPTLTSIWGDANNINPRPANPRVLDPNHTDVVHWIATSFIPAGGPAGTVRLGAVKFRAIGSGRNGNFVWDTGSTVAGPNTSITTQPNGAGLTAVPIVVNSLFTVGTAVADLTIACTQTSPADPNGVVRNFVDGDTIALRCTARNLGTGTSGSTGAVAVLSSD